MRKRVILLLKVLSVLVLMALLLMGTVAPSSAAAPAKPPAPAAAPDETPRKGGTIVVAIEADPPTLYPGFTVDSNTVAVGSKIFNGLTLSDSSFVPRPGAALAESWDISKDGLTYTMHLRKGVKWHDGQPFTCKDVQFSYTQVLPKYYPGGADNYGMVKSVECPDDNTAVFNLSAPFAPLLTAMKPDGGSVLPRHLMKEPIFQRTPRISSLLARAPSCSRSGSAEITSPSSGTQTTL